MFFSALAASPLLVASAYAAAQYPPIPQDKTTPTQQRLSAAGPGEVTVAWNTYQILSKPCVSYGTNDGHLNQKACSSESYTYPTSRTWANTVTLTGLKPATRYYYKIDSTNSTVDYFESGRAAGDKTPFSINSIIDLGVYGEDGYTIKMDQSKRSEIPKIQPALNHTTIGNLAKTIDEYEFIIHPGDFAYADDWFEKGHNLFDGKNAYQAILEQFYQQLAPISGRKVYMVSPGNHEADCQEVGNPTATCPTGQKNFTDFMVRFGTTMPRVFDSPSSNDSARASANKAKALANPPFWYSFDYGMTHFIMFNTETDYDDSKDGPGTTLNAGPFGFDGQQLDFVKADLASVDRSVTPWVVAAGHRPWYTTGEASDGCIPCQKAFEETFYHYGVDLAVFGHVHNSQLFRPVYNNTADTAGYNNPKAPVYVVSGGTGNIEGLTKVGNKQSYNDFAYADDFSYANIAFQSKNDLQVKFIRSSTGETLFTQKLHKDHSQAFVRQ
ncbi:unnamed protein product [Sympodiomycopsis kandeliae]